MAQSIETWILGALNKAGLSIVTAVVSFAAGRLWLSVLYPWLQSFVWQGLRLESSYRGEFKQVGTGQVIHDHVEVKQKAGRVWGTMTVGASRWGKYEFEAKLADGVLRGTFESVGKESNSRGSFLLMAQAGSRELKGWSVEPVDGVVTAYEYTWHSRIR